MSLYIGHAGEKKSVPFILQQNHVEEDKGGHSSQVFLADGDFGTVICKEFQTDLYIFQTIGLKLSTEALFSLTLNSQTILFSFCRQGSFKYHESNQRPKLLAASQGKIYFSENPMTCSFTSNPTGQKEYLLFNMMVPLVLLKHEFSAGISRYLIKRIKQIAHVLPGIEAFTSSIELQKNISEAINELGTTYPDKLQLNGFGLLALLTALDLSEIQASPENLEKGWNPEERMAFLLAESIILGMDEPWSLKELANSGQLNQNKVKTLFKKYMGMPAATFKTSVRLEKAQQLLLDTTLSIQEISLQVGYSNPAHFSSLFKRKIGLTPSNFRKQKNDNDGPLLQG